MCITLCLTRHVFSLYLQVIDTVSKKTQMPWCLSPKVQVTRTLGIVMVGIPLHVLNIR